MKKEKNLFYPWILAALLMSGALAEAQGPPPPPPTPPPTVAPSYDFFKSPAGLNSEQDFAACPVPGIYFEDASTEPLTGCETFDGKLHLRGVPLVTFNGYTVGVVDTAVYRAGEIDFGNPMSDVTVTIPIELQALNLASANPVKIKCDQGMTDWDVTVEIDGATGPSHGEMEVTLDTPANLGGTASSYLNVCPRVTFTRVDSAASGSYELYPCDVGCEFNLLGETSWSYTEPPGGAAGLKIPGLTADNFFFTEPLSAKERQQLALQNLDEGSCPCILKYPHLSENHRHQACLPCPCDSDTVGPVMTPPMAGQSIECNAFESAFPPPVDCIPTSGTVCWDSWFGELDCTEDNGFAGPDCAEEPFKVKYCPVSEPLQLDGTSCAEVNTVTLVGEDCCGNTEQTTQTVTVVDTTAPAVTPRDDILFTISDPPNGDYVCYAGGLTGADFTGVRAPEIEEVCHDYNWVFTGCTSSQPDNGAADGNTTDDCHICQGPNDPLQECQDLNLPAGRAVCVRAERAGNDPAGRFYSFEIAATDECDLTGTPAVIGKAYVPRLPPPPPTCNADTTSGEAPLTVTFSEGTQAAGYVSWDWDFDGDGGTDSSLETPPGYTYDTAGTYYPTLTVNDGIDTYVIDCGPIVVNPPPQPTCELPELKKNASEPDQDGDGLIDFDIRDYYGPNAIVTSITSDEPVSGSGCGNQTPDWEIDPMEAALFEIRAEACANNPGGPGPGNGRVYRVTILIDGQVPSGCGGFVTLCVPHDSSGSGCVDDHP